MYLYLMVLYRSVLFQCFFFVSILSTNNYAYILLGVTIAKTILNNNKNPTIPTTTTTTKENAIIM